jgi:hypothetical protein
MQAVELLTTKIALRLPLAAVLVITRKAITPAANRGTLP